MKERLDPYRGAVEVQPHEMRGSFEECRFQARISSRHIIDNDPARSTGMVTFDLSGTGITFQPGDRLAVMPFNTTAEVDKVAAALGLEDFMNQLVPVEKGSEWSRFSKHMTSISKAPSAGLAVKDILKRGHLAPLTKDLVMSFHLALRASSRTILKILASEEWPVRGSVGDMLQRAIVEVPPSIWDQAFSLDDFSWLPKLIPLEVPRTYSISNYSPELLPSMIDLTVSRTEVPISAVLQPDSSASMSYGISSGFLNPRPKAVGCTCSAEDEEVLIGISRPINFQLPPSATVPIAMFAGGSGIAPFRGFWQSRIHNGIGRNILFMGVQSREKFVYEDELRSLVQEGSLELHLAFSRDRNGLVYDPSLREFISRDMEPRYIDTTIVEQGRLVSELVMSKSQGGQAGYLYICGSVSVYETVMSGIRKSIYKYAAATSETADAILATAFAERRFMLDIFMTPQSVSFKNPIIPLSALAKHTGHQKGSRMWIGVHGGVYDVTDFLDIHPGGTLIVAASAGLDATKTFDDLAHTSNPEVSSLLSKYFIGHLATKPEFRSAEISELYDIFYQYLRTCVESLTTLSFEANYILENSKVWFSGGLFNIGGVRKFYQFQSRLMQNGFSALFGAKLQEIYLKLSFSLASSGAPNIQLPDVVGIITRAQSSQDAAVASKEVSQIGEFVCNQSSTAQFHENGILSYAQTVTQMDLTFIEQVLDEACTAMDVFDKLATMEDTNSRKLMKLSVFLLSILERIAKRLEGFYGSLARESIYHPEAEYNPARSRWNMLRRKIKDGSFFTLAQMPQLNNDGGSSVFRTPGKGNDTVDFSHVFASVQRSLQTAPSVKGQSNRGRSNHSEPGRLADAHTARAATSSSAASTFETREQQNALNRMSIFVRDNRASINRLSRMPADYDYAKLMATYGEEQPPVPDVPPLHVSTAAMSTRSCSRGRTTRQESPNGLNTRRTTQQLVDQLDQGGQQQYSVPPLRRRGTAQNDIPRHDLSSSTTTTTMMMMNSRPHTPSRSQSPVLHRRPRQPSTTSIPGMGRASRSSSTDSTASGMRGPPSVAGSLPGTFHSSGNTFGVSGGSSNAVGSMTTAGSVDARSRTTTMAAAAAHATSKSVTALMAGGLKSFRLGQPDTLEVRRPLART